MRQPCGKDKQEERDEHSGKHEDGDHQSKVSAAVHGLAVNRLYLLNIGWEVNHVNPKFLSVLREWGKRLT